MIRKLISYLYHLLNPNTTAPVVEKEIVVVHTISKETMSKLRARLPNPVITGSDSTEVAAHKLGVQCALLELEKGFVI